MEKALGSLEEGRGRGQGIPPVSVLQEAFPPAAACLQRSAPLRVLRPFPPQSLPAGRRWECPSYFANIWAAPSVPCLGLSFSSEQLWCKILSRLHWWDIPQQYSESRKAEPVIEGSTVEKTSRQDHPGQTAAGGWTAVSVWQAGQRFAF